MAKRAAHHIASHLPIYVALFVALGIGSAWAASKAPKNSVTSASIRNGQVKNADLAKGAVNGAKVKPNSLGGAQIKESSLDSSVLQRRVSGACTTGLSIAAVNSDGTVSCVGTGGPPSGPAGGDLTGNYPNPLVALGAIGTAKLVDGAVTTAKLGNGSVDNAKLADGSVTSLKLANDSVISSRVADNTLTGADIDESSLGTVPNADTLDGQHASNFLQIGDFAGGDLSGPYPDPSIKGDAVTSGKVLNNTLTGADVDESTLGTVPNATNATNASNADTLDGLHAAGFVKLGDSAGGALAGTYPNPTLHVSGGNCPNGQALTNVSNQAVLTCAPGVYSDENSNVGAGPTFAGNPFPSLTAGFGNTAFGRSALQDDTTGNQNTALGSGALTQSTTGNQNTALGYSAGFNLTTGSNNIDIGWNQFGVAGESNTTRIGASQTRAFIAGISGVTTGGVASPVLVDNNGQLGTTSSSLRFKRDIHPLASASRRLMKLNPVSFRYKRSYVHGPSVLQYGLLAEQVAKVYPNLVVHGRDGKPSAIAYQELPALLLAQAQQEKARNDRQQAKIRHQQAQINWLMRQVRSR